VKGVVDLGAEFRIGDASASPSAAPGEPAQTATEGPGEPAGEVAVP
jgi:hypothetical protein